MRLFYKVFRDITGDPITFHARKVYYTPILTQAFRGQRVRNVVTNTCGPVYEFSNETIFTALIQNGVFSWAAHEYYLKFYKRNLLDTETLVYVIDDVYGEMYVPLYNLDIV